MIHGAPNQGVAKRRAWPLVVSLAVHALLVLAWLHFGAREGVPDERPRPYSLLLFPKLQGTPAPLALPKAQTLPRTRSRHAAPDDIAPARRADPATPVFLSPEPASPSAQPPAAAAPSAADILNAAKRSIAGIDRELRGAKAGVLQPGDSAWGRFERSVESAHVESSRTKSVESYTSPDGETYYRIRVGDKVVCRKTGSVGPPAPWRSDEATRAGAGSVATLGVAGSAGYVLCPGSARDWVRQ
jgi:hypothetical protein